jgi:outer membrane protein assembly factor BamB
MIKLSEKQIKHLSLIIPVLLGAVVLTWWFLSTPVSDLSMLQPGLDNRPADAGSQQPKVDIGSYFASFGGQASGIMTQWPRFRGKDFDNISKERVVLADSWSAGGPPVLWSVELGEGHSGPAVAYGRVYILDYDEENRRDILRCFSLDDGTELWQRGYDIYVKRNHGMSRTIPAIFDSMVVTIGPKCQVMCTRADSGEFVWGRDLVAEFGTEVPLWYTGQCPLVDDSCAVIATGGDHLLVGFDLYTGEIRWQSENPNGWQMSHSSVIPMNLHGTRVYVYCATGGLVGISAEPESRGEILFFSNQWNPSVIAPSPVHVGDGQIYVTAGYGAGSQHFQVSKNNGSWSIESLQTCEPDQGLASEQQTAILYKDHLFGILPKDAGPQRNQFVCCSSRDCSEIIWTSGKTERFGLGPFLLADDNFFILSDEGVLTIARASTREYIKVSQTKILDGHDAWGPLALVEGRLLARDSRRMVCLDIRAN